MKNWINKHFRKGQCVVAMVYSQDRRAKLHYIIPKNDTITINNHSWMLSENDMFLYKGIPHYVLTTKNAEPVKINPLNEDNTYKSAKDYNTAISSAVAREIFLSTKRGFDSGVLSLILTGVLLVAFIFVAYTGSNILTELQTKITEIRELLSLLGGV